MSEEYDVILRNGSIYDGSGTEPYRGDVAINGHKIVATGDLKNAKARRELDVSGLAVAPGFINVMSWAPVSSLEDGRSQSEIRQGITLEVFGEAWSEGPLTEAMRKEVIRDQGDIKYDVPWTTLGEFLEYLAAKGVSTNIASYLGATTLRIYALGYEDRDPTTEELDLMRRLTRQAMEEGAMGVSTALIYAPGSYAKTEEIIALAKEASAYGGVYISHVRSEGNAFLEAIDELITIAKEAKIHAEIYHLKAMGKDNWYKMELALQKVEDARAQGLDITADMYTYTAGATGLDAVMPGWVQEGGYHAWAERLKDPQVRQRLRQEMSTPTNEWENMLLMSGGPENVQLAEFKNDDLKYLTGKTLAEAASMLGKDIYDTIFDLVIEDGSRVGTIYFTMTEDNLRRQIRKPWVCFGSDAASVAPEGVFLKSNPHPRAYGNFARLLGKYVREEKIISLSEAVRRMTSFPAQNLSIKGRGWLKPGYFADIAVFDPEKIKDNATFSEPHQYAEGMVHVFVNGVQVLNEGEHTGAKPGQVVRGPGYKK